MKIIKKSKLGSVLLTAVLSISLVGCGSSNTPEANAKANDSKSKNSNTPSATEQASPL